MSPRALSSRQPPMVAGVVLLLCAGCLTGCGPGIGDVSGKVTYKGSSVTSGQVVIIGSDNLPKYGEIRDDGTFAVVGVAAGESKVGVNSPSPKPSASKRPVEKNRPEVEAAGREDKPPAFTEAQRKTWVAIPEKYGNPVTSPYKLTVAPGKNAHDIQLTD
jgi:hypothetical protein